MPGKVNLAIPEAVTQVCYAVIGNDLTINMAARAGQLQLDAFEPVIATMAGHVHDSIGLATALNPYLGYANASEIAREALATERSVTDIALAVTDIALEREYLPEMQLPHILAPERLANLSAETLRRQVIR